MKKQLLLLISLLLVITLVGCKKIQESINYQESVTVPALIEVDIENVPSSLRSYVDIHNYDDVIKVTFDLDDVIWEKEGDYSIKVIVDYRDGVSQSFNSVLRLSLLENFGKPQIIGVKNRIFDVGTTGINLLDNIAFTDTDEVVNYGLIGTVNYNEEGVYQVEYFVEDNDGNRVSKEAFVIIGEIADEYYEFTKILYNLTTTEKAILYEYSLLYTATEESISISDASILSEIGFFVSVELFEFYLERELRIDEYETIMRAKEVFKNNTIRLLRDKYNWTLSELVRDYLDRAHELHTDYLQYSIVRDYGYNAYNRYTGPDSFNILLHYDGLISEFDLASLEFYDKIKKIYFDEDMLLVEEFTDYTFDESIFEDNHFGNSDYYSDIQRILFLDLLNKTPGYYSYKLEYYMQEYLIHNGYINVDINEIMAVHEVTKNSLDSEDSIMRYNTMYQYLTISDYENYLEIELSDEERKLYEIYIEFFHSTCNNVLHSFIETHKDELSEEDIEGIIYTYQTAFSEGLYESRYIEQLFAFDYSDYEEDVIKKYLKYVSYIIQRDELTLHKSLINDIEEYTLEDYFAHISSFKNADKYITFDDDFDVDFAANVYFQHMSNYWTLSYVFGYQLSDSDTLLVNKTIHEILTSFYSNNTSNQDIDVYAYLATLNREYLYKILNEEDIDTDILDSYEKVASDYVKKHYDLYIERYMPLCIDICNELYDQLAEETNYPPALIMTFSSNNRYMPMTNGLLYQAYIDDEGIKLLIEELDIYLHETVSFYENINSYNVFTKYHNTPYFHEEHNQHLKTYYKYYLSGVNSESFGVPSKLLLLHEMSKTENELEFQPLPPDVEEALLYFENYSKLYELKSETEYISYLSEDMPKLIKKSIILDYINYKKEIPLFSNDQEYPELYSKYEESINHFEAYKWYSQNHLSNMYRLAEEKGTEDLLFEAHSILIEHDMDLWTFKYQVSHLYEPHQLITSWLSELTEDELAVLYDVSDTVMEVVAIEDLDSLHRLEYIYDSNFLSEVYEFNKLLIKSQILIDYDLTHIETAFGRPLTETEILLVDIIQSCSKKSDCNLPNDIRILVELEYLDHDFTSSDLLQAINAISTVSFDDVKDQITYDYPIEYIFDFQSKYLLQEEHVTPSYISEYVITSLLLEIDEYYHSEMDLDTFSNFVNYRIDKLYNLEDYGDATLIMLYFHNETLKDLLYPYIIAFSQNREQDSIDDLYNVYINILWRSGMTDFQEIPKLFDDQTLKYFMFEQAKLSTNNIFNHGEGILIDFDDSKATTIHQMNPNDINQYDEDVHELNLIICAYIISAYLETDHIVTYSNDGAVIFDDEDFDRLNEIYTLYQEYYHYANQEDPVKEIMADIGIKLTEEEIIFLEYITDLYVPDRGPLEE